MDEELIYFEDYVKEHKSTRMNAILSKRRCPMKIVFITKKEREDANNIDRLTIRYGLSQFRTNSKSRNSVSKSIDLLALGK